MRASLAALALFVLSLPLNAQELAIKAGDTAQSLLATHKGKRVTVRVKSGHELSGIVRDVNERLLVLGGLGGREYFDAAVPLDAVEAVLVRVKQ